MDGVSPVTNPLGALENMISPLSRMMTEGYEQNKAQLEALKNLAQRSPEVDNAEQWAAMAQAAAQVPPVVGGFGRLLASIGSAYGQVLNRQEQERFARQAKIAELTDKLAVPFGAGSVTAMTHAALNPIQNIGGVGVDRLTGQLIVPKSLIDEYLKLYREFYKSAVENKMPNAEQWAHAQATYALKQKTLNDPSIAGSLYGQGPGRAPLPSQIGHTSTQSAPQDDNAQPLESQNADLVTQPADTSLTGVGKPPIVDVPTEKLGKWIQALKDNEREAIRNGDYARAIEINKARRALEAKLRDQVSGAASDALSNKDNAVMPSQDNAAPSESLTNVETRKPETTNNSGVNASPPPPLSYLDKRIDKFQEKWGEHEAASLEKALNEASSIISKSADTISTLNTLEGLLNVENMPQGKFAPLLVEARSALSSFGIDVDKTTSPAQVAEALSKNFALRLRTGSGENLMPGQMSNYEDRILMSMAPALSQTREGRNALLQFMREAVNSRIRIANKAQEFAAEHNGMLTPEWRALAAKLEQVELAKREYMRREIMKKFFSNQGQK